MGRGFPNTEVSEEALFVESENLAIRLASAWDRLADCLLSAAIRDAMERVCSDERLFVNAWANWADCLLSSAVREAKALACLIRFGRLPVERSRTGCRIGRMLPGVLRCLGRLFRLFRNGRARCVLRSAHRLSKAAARGRSVRSHLRHSSRLRRKRTFVARRITSGGFPRCSELRLFGVGGLRKYGLPYRAFGKVKANRQERG